MRRLMVVALAVASATELMAVQGTLSTNSDSVTGDIKWRARDKKYVITKGNINIERNFADVTSLDIPKPAELDKAISQVEGGQGASAIATLSKICADYRMLKWDKFACRYLALAYLSANNAQKAYDECTKIINDDKTAAYVGEVAPAYWKSLLQLGKREKLDELLKKASTSGDRRASASALTMRGDILVAGANGAADKLMAALRDGYLRVALMYNDAECVAERREALLKAADCFDQLGQAVRAEKLRAEAKSI